jgi:tRNA threonylcarbamoyladenosine biosynthesis protein TsaB
LLFLGIDTATRVGSVGLVRAALDHDRPTSIEAGRIAEGCELLAEVTRDTGLGHGTELLPIIDECLASAGAQLEDVACIAVSLGPGSFTGLRVALATAKGLALGGAVSLIGVPTLEALAATMLPGWTPDSTSAPCSSGTVIAPCLDARKGEVYGATFVVREPAWSDPLPRLERTSEDAAFAPDDFHAALVARIGRDTRVILLGDGATRYAREIAEPIAQRATVLSLESRPPSGATVARVATGRLVARGPDDRGTLVPRYARASEAEIMRERRGGAVSR